MFQPVQINDDKTIRVRTPGTAAHPDDKQLMILTQPGDPN